MKSLRISIFNVSWNESSVTRPPHPAGNAPRPHVHDKADPANSNRVARNGRQLSSSLTTTVITTLSFRTTNMVSHYSVMCYVNENLRSQICSTQILWFSKFWRLFHERHQLASFCRSRSGTWKRCWTAWRRGWTISCRNLRPESKRASSWPRQRSVLPNLEICLQILFKDLQREVADFPLPDLEAEYTDEEGDRLDNALDKYNDLRQSLAEVQVLNKL